MYQLTRHFDNIKQVFALNDPTVVFTLRQILEKCTEMNCKMLVNFIDFRKAFECVHRPYAWNIMKFYGTPTKIVDIGPKGFLQKSRLLDVL